MTFPLPSPGRAFSALALALLLLPAGAARASGNWTNAAGHAVRAELLRVEGSSAIFRKADGATFSMPLASLSPASRRQALEETGKTPVPESLQADYALCVRTLKRLGALREAGKLDEAAFALQRETALARLKEAFTRLEVPEGSRDRLLKMARNH